MSANLIETILAKTNLIADEIVDAVEVDGAIIVDLAPDAQIGGRFLVINW